VWHRPQATQHFRELNTIWGEIVAPHQAIYLVLINNVLLLNATLTVFERQYANSHKHLSLGIYNGNSLSELMPKRGCFLFSRLYGKKGKLIDRQTKHLVLKADIHAECQSRQVV
jgi:uracil DNA glycosylase